MASNSGPARNQKGDSPSRAAFRLGLLGHTMSGIWVDLFREMPDWELRTGDGILLSIRQMEDALLILAQEVPGNVFHDLRRLLRQLTDAWEPVVREIGLADYHGRAPDLGRLSAPRHQDLDDVRLLTEQAIVASSPCWAWLNLG